MQIFSTFEHSSFLEVSIALIEKEGVKKENIFAIPLDNRVEQRKVFDTMNRSDGTTLIDIGMALATAFAVIGASVGFILAWGPIYWGLIGAFIGFMIGFAIRLFTELVIKKRKRVLKGQHSELILIIECEDSLSSVIEKILWDHFALGVAKIKQENNNV